MEHLALLMFVVLVFFLLLGYPVAFTLGGTALLFGLASQGIEFFDLLPLRIWGTMTNFSLLAVPLFIFMGVMLEKSGLAEDLLETMGLLFGRMRGGSQSPSSSSGRSLPRRLASWGPQSSRWASSPFPRCSSTATRRSSRRGRSPRRGLSARSSRRASFSSSWATSWGSPSGSSSWRPSCRASRSLASSLST